MHILGIGQIGGVDSSAVLVEDGALQFAVEEERLARIKHMGGFPHGAIQCCLSEGHLHLEDVQHIAIIDQPWLRFTARLFRRDGPNLLRYPKNALYQIFHNEIPALVDFLKYAEKLQQASRSRAKIHFIRHHDAHAASAFLVSPFDEAAILTADAQGEITTTTIGIGRGNRFTTIEEQVLPHSLGVFYAAITDYLGFRYNEDEYKVMGLAAFGEPEFLDVFRRMIRYSERSLIEMDLDFFTHQTGRGFLSKKFLRTFGPPRRPDDPVTRRHRNIAASAQAVLEEIGVHIAKALYMKTRQKNLCLAGGVAFNCVMNGRIYKEGIFEQLFVQPAAGDAGGALGGAFYVEHCILGRPRRYVMRTAALGPEYTNAQIEADLISAKVPYTKASNLVEETAELMTQGNIVGWFQGRMEFGPRALGYRSILADPTQRDMKDRINALVKHREEFRPFAPAVKRTKASEYFKLDFDSPFMLFVVDVVESKRSLLPAVTHVDGTARVQCVNEEENPRFWQLLDAFEHLTGVPVLLNTSFNVMGEPIVCTPHEALRCFYSTGLDYLAIGDFLVSKQPGRVASRSTEVGRMIGSHDQPGKPVSVP